MEAIVRPPIFVLDREGWISVFDSVASTEAGLETSDVETGEYVALDAAGRPLLLTVVEGTRSGRWWSRPGATVKLDVGSADAQPEVLRRVLIDAGADDAGPGDQSLDSLIATARARKDPRATRIVDEVRAALEPPAAGGRGGAGS